MADIKSNKSTLCDVAYTSLVLKSENPKNGLELLPIVENMNKIEVQDGYKARFKITPEIQPAAVEEIDYSAVTAVCGKTKEFTQCDCINNEFVEFEMGKRVQCAYTYTDCLSKMVGGEKITTKAERAIHLETSLNKGMVRNVVRSLLENGTAVDGATLSDGATGAEIIAVLKKIQNGYDALYYNRTWSAGGSILEQSGSTMAQWVYLDAKYFRELQISADSTKCCTENDMYKQSRDRIMFGDMVVMPIRGLKKETGVELMAYYAPYAMLALGCPNTKRNFKAIMEFQRDVTWMENGVVKKADINTGEAVFETGVFDTLSVVYVGTPIAPELKTQTKIGK